MSKPRSIKRKRLRATTRSHHGPCFKEGCHHNGGLMHHCKICEALKAAGKLDSEPFTVQFCGEHLIEAAMRIKRHVLLKHPATIPAWMMAKLSGGA